MTFDFQIGTTLKADGFENKTEVYTNFLAIFSRRKI